MQIEYGGRLMPILGPYPHLGTPIRILIQIQEPWIRILIRITTKLPSFQSLAAAEAAPRTLLMKKPFLLLLPIIIYGT